MEIYKKYLKNPKLKFKTQEELFIQVSERVKHLLEVRGINRKYLKANYPDNYWRFTRAMRGASVRLIDVHIFATVLGVRVSDIMGEEPISVILERPTLRMIAEELLKFEKLAPSIPDIPLDLIRVLSDEKMQEVVTEAIKKHVANAKEWEQKQSREKP